MWLLPYGLPLYLQCIRFYKSIMISSFGSTLSYHKKHNCRWLVFLHHFCHSPTSLTFWLSPAFLFVLSLSLPLSGLFSSLHDELMANKTNIGPGPLQAERTQSSRAEQQGCYITFCMIPLQRLLTVPYQQHRFSERKDSWLKMSGWGKTMAAGWCSKPRNIGEFSWIRPVLFSSWNCDMTSDLCKQKCQTIDGFKGLKSFLGLVW